MWVCEESIFFRQILITLVRSATSLHLHKCIARFVSDSRVSCYILLYGLRPLRGTRGPAKLRKNFGRILEHIFYRPDHLNQSECEMHNHLKCSVAVLLQLSDVLSLLLWSLRISSWCAFSALTLLFWRCKGRLAYRVLCKQSTRFFWGRQACIGTGLCLGNCQKYAG